MEPSYEQAVAALESALTFGVHPSLESIASMCETLGRPQDSFASVQVTGTNGKSSVTRMIAALLREQGARAGCYTSPHLDEYVERIEIDGVVATRERFAAGVGAAMDAARDASIAAPTEFELLTAAALWLFRDARVDYASLEVGMGGRWDATSVVDPAVAVVTGVGLDHTAQLGTTREQIAADKSWIIKPACAPILGPGTIGVERVFLERAAGFELHPRAVRESGLPSPVDDALTVRFQVEGRDAQRVSVRIDGVHAVYDSIELPAPVYQAANAATAVAAAEALLGRALDSEGVRTALRDFRVPARFETVLASPRVIVDGSHNPQAAAVLAQAIEEELVQAPVIVLGVLADKDARGIVEALAPVADGWAVCTPDSPRALPAHELAVIVRDVAGVEPRVMGGPAEAVEGLLGEGIGAIVATGSLVTAAQVRRALLAG